MQVVLAYDSLHVFYSGGRQVMTARVGMWIVLAVGLILWGGATLPAEETAAGESSFRDLIRKFVAQSTAGPASGSKPNAPVAGLPEGIDKIVALEYTVLLRTPAGEQAVDASTHQFLLGDQIRVRIKPLTGLYIYIFHEGASGARTCLLPTEKETPPLARPDRSVDLPSDGSIFEFAPPAGKETLIVVALDEPSDDLATLSHVIFKKPDDQLTPEEQKLRQSLKARHDQTLKSILERQAQSARYRGLFSDESIAKLTGEMQRTGATRAVLEEPPHGANRSAFAMSATRAGGGRNELFITIPLESMAKTAER